MDGHHCKSVVVTCMDFRLQKYLADWLAQNYQSEGYDRVAYAGGVKEFETILGQIELSKKLHGISQVVLVNHENCGEYGIEGTPQRHAQDLQQASAKIKQLHPDVQVQTYYLHLDGTFEAI